MKLDNIIKLTIITLIISVLAYYNYWDYRIYQSGEVIYAEVTSFEKANKGKYSCELTYTYKGVEYVNSISVYKIPKYLNDCFDNEKKTACSGITIPIKILPSDPTKMHTVNW